MKKILLIGFMVFLFVSCGGDASSDSGSCTVKSELVGTWLNPSGESDGDIIFKSDGTVHGFADGEGWATWCVSENIIHTDGTYTYGSEEDDKDVAEIAEYTFAIDGDSFFWAPYVRISGSDANGVWIASWKVVWPDFGENNEESGESTALTP